MIFLVGEDLNKCEEYGDYELLFLAFVEVFSFDRDVYF
jgi:hypothetical protein